MLKAVSGRQEVSKVAALAEHGKKQSGRPEGQSFGVVDFKEQVAKQGRMQSRARNYHRWEGCRGAVSSREAVSKEAALAQKHAANN